MFCLQVDCVNSLTDARIETECNCVAMSYAHVLDLQAIEASAVFTKAMG